MANTIQVLVSAKVESSIEQLKKDLLTIQEKIKAEQLEVDIEARIKKIHIDQSAVNYVTNEIKKMFNTVTVDIDGNILGVGKGTAIKKQAENVQKAVLDAQKRLKGVEITYGDNLDPGQLLKLQQFSARLKDLKNNANATSVDVKAFTTDLDVFSKTLLSNTKELNANATAQEKQNEAVRKALNAVQKKTGNFNVSYGSSLSKDQLAVYNNYITRLKEMRNSKSTTMTEVDTLATDFDVFAASVAKSTKELSANAVAQEKQVAAVQKASAVLQKKIDTADVNYGSSMSSGQHLRMAAYINKLAELRDSGDTTKADIDQLAADFDVFTASVAKSTKELEANANAQKKQASEVQKAAASMQKKLDIADVKYGDSMTPAQLTVMENYSDALERLRTNGNTTKSDIDQLAANFDVFTTSVAKSTEELNANAAAQEKQKIAVEAAVSGAQKKLQNLKDSYGLSSTYYPDTTKLYEKRLSDLLSNKNTTVADVKKVSEAIDAFGQKLEANKKRMAENARQAEQLQEAYRKASDVVFDLTNNYGTGITKNQQDSFATLEKEYNELVQSGQATPDGVKKYIQDFEELRDKIKQTAAVQREFESASSIDRNIRGIGESNLTESQLQEYKELKKQLNSVDLDSPNVSSVANISKEFKTLQADIQRTLSAYKEYEKATSTIDKIDSLGILKEGTELSGKYGELKKQLENVDIKKVDAGSSYAGITKELEKILSALEKEKSATEAWNKAIKEANLGVREVATQANTVQGMLGDYKKESANTEGSSLSTFYESVVAYANEYASVFDSFGKDNPLSLFSENFEKGVLNGQNFLEVLKAIKNHLIESNDAEGLDVFNNKLKKFSSMLSDKRVDLRAKLDLEQDTTNTEKFRNTLQKDIDKLEEFYSKYYKIRLDSKMSQRYKELQNSFGDIQVGDTADLKKAGGELDDFIARAKELGLTTETAGEKIQKAFQKFGGWTLVTGIMMKAVGTIKDMVSTVITLDTALTELKKVTDETSASYDAFMQRAKETAKEIGSTMADVVSATASWARLGYSIEDAEVLAKASLIYSNVGDELDGVDEASEHLISTMQAFKIEATDVMSIVDQLNAVGNTEAISSGGVGTALAKSGAALEAAGNTMQESMAMIAAMNTTLQDPETVGTTMKTLSMYLRAAETECEEAGESTEGMASSVSELRDEILSLTGNKVDIQIDDETFKSSYQIMKELAGVWDELSDISQANLLEQIAGKRNANAVTALIENFEIAERVMGTLENSSGSALKENEKYLDSIEGRIQKFQATFESLSTTVVNTDLVKGTVSGATELLSVVDEFIEKVGTLPVVTMAALSAMNIGGIGLFDFKVDTDGTIFDDGLFASAFKNSNKYKSIISEIDKYNDIWNQHASLAGDLAKSLSEAESASDEAVKEAAEKAAEEMSKEVAKLSSQMQTAAKSMRSYDSAMADAMENQEELGVSGKEYAASLSSISKQAIKAAAATIAINVGISAVIALVEIAASEAYDALVVTSEEMEKCAAGASDLAESFSENDTWISSIEELQEKLSDENLSLSEQNALKEQLLSIQDSIVEKYGDEAKAIDLVNGGYQEMIDKLDELSAKEFNTWEVNNRDAIEESIEKYTTPEYRVPFGTGSYEKFLNVASSEDAESLRKVISIFSSTIEGDLSGLRTEYVGDLNELSDQLVHVYEIVSKYNTDGEFDSLLKKISNLSSKASSDIETYGDTYKRYVEGIVSTNKTLSNSYDSIQSASDVFNEAIVNGTPDEVASAYDVLQISIDSFFNAIDNSTVENADGVRKYYEGVFDDLESAAKAKSIEVELKADDTSLYWDVTNAIDSLDRMGYSSVVEIKSALTTGSISENSDAFYLLTELAEGLDTTLVGVIDKLESFGYFGEEGVAVVTDEIQNAIDSYMKVASVLSEVRDEQEKFGSVSIETYNKITSMGEDYEDVLEMQNGAYVFSAEGAQELLDEQYELAYAILAGENATEDQIESLQTYYVVLSSFRSQMSTCVDSIQELNGVQEKLAEGTQFTKEEVDELLEKYPDLSFAIDESTGYWDLQAESLDNLQDHFKDLIETIIEFEKHITALQQQSILEDAGYASGVVMQSSLSRWVNESGATSVEEYADYYGLNVEDIPDHTKKVLELEFQLSGEVAAYEKMISGEVSTEGFGGTSTGSSGSSESSSTDTWKEAFEEQYKELQHQRAMERITEEQYVNAVEVLYKQYFSDLSKYRDEYYRYEEEVYSGRQSLIDEYISDLEQEYEYLGDEARIISALNELLAERVDILSDEQVETVNTKLLEYQEQIYRKQIDALEEKNDVLEDSEDTEEEIISNYKSMINLLYDIKSVYGGIYSENSELMISLESEISDLTSNISKIKKELWEAQRDAQVDALEEEQDAIEDYQDAIDDVLSATVDLIKRETEAEIEALEDAQDARDEWYDNEIDRIEEVADARKEALEEELEGYRKIIEAKKEALQDEVDEEDYNAEVATKAKEISDLQSKIDALSLDDSKSATAERLQLEEELSEKKEELAKYQRDYSLDKQLEALDDELEAFEDQQNEKIDLIEEQADAEKEYLEQQKEAVSKSYEEQIEALRDHLDKEGVLWQEANNRLKTEGSSLFEELRSYAKEYTTDVEGLEEAWNKVLAAVNSYNGGTLDLLDTSSNMSSVSTKNEETIKNLEDTTYEDTQNTSEAVNERTLIAQYKSLMKSSSEAWKMANEAGSTSEMAYWSQRNQELAAELNKKLGREALTYNKWKGVWYLDGVQFYHKGGVAGGTGSLEQNELLAVLKKREMVLTEPMQETLAKYVQFAKSMSTSIVSMLSDDPVGNIVSKLQNRGTVAQTTANTISVGKLFDFHADSITKDSLSETEDMLKRAADYTVRKLEDRLSRRGIKTKTSGI